MIRRVDGALTASLRRSPPALHGEAEFWGIAWEALEWIERNVQPGMATLETGSGATTIVFTAGGAVHEAVTPDPAEETRVRTACAERDIDDSRLTFHIGRRRTSCTDSGARAALDLVLLDGAHGFPYPILDWWFLAPRAPRRGPDAPRRRVPPAVASIVDYARSSEAWALEEPISFRTACIRKVQRGHAAERCRRARREGPDELRVPAARATRGRLDQDARLLDPSRALARPASCGRRRKA